MARLLEPLSIPERSAQASDLLPMHPPHIILVEDNLLLQEALAEHLREQGFVVHALVDGSGVDALLQTQTVDLLILDLNLPQENGFSIATRVRSAYPYMGILILSARLPAYGGASWAPTVDLLMAKPVAPDALLNAAMDLCALSQSRRP